ncbi:MAG: CAP domain-containing protein [Paludibacteraceae bacterium]|nr:CAP domain-containing protein [Paludibacteraceae bacterium]
MRHRLLTAATMLALALVAHGEDFIKTTTSTQYSIKNGVTTTVTVVKKYTADGKVYTTTTTKRSDSTKPVVKTTVGYEKDTDTAGGVEQSGSSAEEKVWTDEEMKSANTTANVSYLTAEEKKVIMYVNLARLYPKKYAEKEVLARQKSTSVYIRDAVSKTESVNSLVSTLKSMKPLPAYQFSKELYDFAKCFAVESGSSGYIGHKRKKCVGGSFSECCSYGPGQGRDIVLLLLIDAGVTDLGHRKNCLSPNHKRIGCSIQSHQKTDKCCVIDIGR